MRPAPGGGINIARTPDNTIWNNLPFLATDMTDFWINNYAAMGAKQHLNTSTFFAKLASTRVANNKLCQIALLVFRATFKSMQPLGSSDKLDNKDPYQVAHTLTIAVLLPSACAWFQEARHNIVLLSDVSWNNCSSSTIRECGLAFANSELGQQSPGGFNPWRWLYWIKQRKLMRRSLQSMP
ncbi:hypothetical protein BDW59DRAFT_155262 [Aspergillus cavernicola]|uniref:Uncharacterized protein n=1 Tax=Aspergillus cavernicola TaxID=176166 RepID=A0ABR4HAP5_9EURO